MQRSREAVFNHLGFAQIVERRVEFAKIAEVLEDRFDDGVDDIFRGLQRSHEVAPTPKVLTSSELPL